MWCRFSLSLSLFDFAKGWLVLQLGRDVEEVELILERPLCLSPGLLSMFSIQVRGLAMLTSLVFSKSEPMDVYTCVDEVCFSVSRADHVRSYSYGLPLRLTAHLRGELARVYDFARVLRPRVMAELTHVRVAEVRVRTALPECREILHEIRLHYEFPHVQTLPQYLTRDLPRVVSNRIIIQGFEDYLLGLATSEKMRRLRQAGIIRDDGKLTRLGQVAALCLAPHLISVEDVQSLKALLKQDS